MFNRRKLLLCLIDTVCFGAVYFTMAMVTNFSSTAIVLAPIECFFNGVILYLITMVLRFVFKIYDNIWRYANSKAYLHMVISDGISAVFGIAVTRLISCYIGFWQTAIVILAFCLLTLTNRFIYQQKKSREITPMSEKKINVAIVGAGRVGVLLAEELLASKRSQYKPFCFIDNDEDKVGKTVNGLRVYAEDDKIIENLKRMPIREIILALPKLGVADTKKLYELYSKTGCKVKIYDVPVADIGALAHEKKTIRDIKIEDLLFRDSLDISDEKLKHHYNGKTVLVTGGGGSIGSELCRQLVKCKIKKLIILDIYENNAYDIEQELKRKLGENIELCVEIASVRDKERLECIFDYYRPQIVFHAAAHKHVPLMEHSGCEAIKNNIFGTYNTANMAEKYGAERFILISTDKAVSPTNIMGASKRMCEMVIQCRSDSDTIFTAVRFGNVLGSNGSVIPLFRKQIEEGGPITVTDKRIIRYFMTIPEASQLVMQAGANAKSGELFVLDMGKPIRIIDLAENMIRLSGLVPYEDIDIIETGLRPGEKLYEELLIKNEEINKTENDLIFIERDNPLDRQAVEEKLDILKQAIGSAKHEIGSDTVKTAMKRVVPTYFDPEEINKNAETSKEMMAVK